jgi:hypothetical protein
VPTVKIPIFAPVQKGVDGIELTDENFSLFDGYRTLTGGTTKRPGSKTIFTASAALGVGVDGIFYWAEKDVVMMVGGGDIYQLTYVSNTPVVTKLTSTPLLNQGTPVSMTVDGTNFYCCNGGRIITTTVSGTPSQITAVGAPTAATHLQFLDGYILATNGSNTMYWSDVNNGSSWNALNFASAAGSPDVIRALKVFNREIYLLGERSIEVWENDGSTPFGRIPGGFIESGCSSPYAIIEDENSLYWLDENRRLVRFTGKSVERLSTKFDRELQGLSKVSDAIAQKIQIDGYVFFVFSFPFDGRTLVYNQTVDDWGEWGKWNLSDAVYERWVGSAYCYAERWGLHLIGRRDVLKVAELGRGYADDDGDVIRLARLTGHIDNGTSKVKQCNEVRFRAKRGQGLSDRVPRLMLRYKIDNRTWSNVKEFSLGAIGEYDFIVTDIRRNQYRTKQYEFTATDAVNIVFSNAEEDVEVLR